MRPLRHGVIDANLPSIELNSIQLVSCCRCIVESFEVDESESARATSRMIVDEVDLLNLSEFIEHLSEILLCCVHREIEDAQTTGRIGRITLVPN